MPAKRKLFFQRDPYKIEEKDELFLELVKENIAFHREHCASYRAVLENCKFEIQALRTEADLYRIPVISTLYFKRNRLFSLAEDKLCIKATSSGTQGLQSMVGFDRKSLIYGIGMMYRFFSYHKVISLWPTNYIVLGYEPSMETQMGAVKTAYGTTKFAPAIHREYAIKSTKTGYCINMEGIQKALEKYSKQPWPVRFVGFPSYLYFLVKTLRERNISLRFNRHSKILLGGGWKQFAKEEIDREEFFALIQDTLNIKRENCLEFFSAVEHPLPYCKCAQGHFHVPAYSRAIIRDVHTLAPLPYGQLGLLSFVSPLVTSMPLVSVVTDDLAVLHDGKTCGCSIETPYFTLEGRAGVKQIKTCTTDAAELLGGMKN